MLFECLLRGEPQHTAASIPALQYTMLLARAVASEVVLAGAGKASRGHDRVGRHAAMHSLPTRAGATNISHSDRWLSCAFTSTGSLPRRGHRHAGLLDLCTDEARLRVYKAKRARCRCWRRGINC